MGCGESKHAVATADSTITRKKTDHATKPEVNETSQNGNRNENAEVKDIAEDKELKGGIDTGRLISKESPNRYFSSRKDEDIEGIASEKSEYYSPCIKSGKESLFNDGVVKSDDAIVGETLVQETKQGEALVQETKQGETIVQETKQQTEKKGEPEIEKKKDMAKEEKIGASIESQVPSPDEDKKQNAEGKLAVSPSQDLKTNVKET